MPSWKVHNIVGELLLGYWNPEIDEIIDSKLGHDSSRYDVDKLIEGIDYVYLKFGENGVKYFVLHHYLDRLVDILISEISIAYECYIGYKLDFTDICVKIRNNALNLLLSDPKNIFSLFLIDPQKLKMLLGIYYWGNSKRGQRRNFEKIIDIAHSKISKYRKFSFVKEIVEIIVRKIQERFDRIVFLVLTDETFKERKTLSRIEHAIKNKSSKKYYRLNPRIMEYIRGLNVNIQKTNEEHFENIPKFLDRIVEYFSQ